MKKLNLTLLIILITTLTTGCRESSDMNKNISRTGLEIGTVVSITLYDTDDETIMDGAFDILKEIDKNFSLTINSSTLNDINKNAFKAPVEINNDIFQVIKSSLYYSELSDGLFDITIEPLVSLWGIGSESPRVPESHEIQLALDSVDYKNIDLMESTISFDSPSTKLDLGSIAKGYAADKIVNYLNEHNVNRSIISLGGNIYAHGSKSKDTPWRIGIQNPTEDRGDIVGTLTVSNKSVVTSGLYERYFEDKGVKYHHILNTKDGYPIENGLLGVSIVSDKSIDGDALSTIAFILGLDKGIALIENLNNIDAIFITKESKVYTTSGIKDVFTLTNDGFELVQ